MIPSSFTIFKSIIAIIPLFFFALISFLILPLSLSQPSNQFKFNNSVVVMPGKRNLSPPSTPSLAMFPPNKKLRRLPHVFSKVLELPFSSDADVSIEDFPDRLRFVAEEGDGVVVVGGEVRAHLIEVHPGVTKVVVRRKGNRSLSSIDDLELNLWRFRLPATAKPELAEAVYAGGKLVVTVPKHGWEESNCCGEDCKGGSFRSDNMGSLVIV